MNLIPTFKEKLLILQIKFNIKIIKNFIKIGFF
jgi:hypothetical protein